MTLLGHLSRFINGLIPGALKDESLCGRACREWGSSSPVCRVLDGMLGRWHCLDEMIWCLKGLRKK